VRPRSKRNELEISSRSGAGIQTVATGSPGSRQKTARRIEQPAPIRLGFKLETQAPEASFARRAKSPRSGDVVNRWRRACRAIAAVAIAGDRVRTTTCSSTSLHPRRQAGGEPRSASVPRSDSFAEAEHRMRGEALGGRLRASPPHLRRYAWVVPPMLWQYRLKPPGGQMSPAILSRADPWQHPQPGRANRAPPWFLRRARSTQDPRKPLFHLAEFR